MGIYLRGVAMGVAEIIPGVSGGTIAFITGIYRELLGTITRFGIGSPGLLWRAGFRAFAVEHNLVFVALLGAGMATSVALLAGLVTQLLATAPVLVWAFFFGLIAASVVDLVRDNVFRHLLTAGVLGLAAGLAVALADPAPAGAEDAWLFFGGMLAICAWILPGISGSYVLLLLGLYPQVIAAISTFDVAVLVVFTSGCILGLALFARGAAWLMRRYYYPAMALFTGFMAGSLMSLWPWHLPAPVLGSEQLYDLPAGPWSYAAATGMDAQALPALLVAALGVAIVLTLARFRPDRASHRAPDGRH